jgi:hypothetical protein
MKKDDSIQMIYRNYAEFHLRDHIADLKRNYLHKSLGSKRLTRLVFKQHHEVYRDELSDRLSELSRNDRPAIKVLKAIRDEYLRKLKSKVPIDNP